MIPAITGSGSVKLRIATLTGMISMNIDDPEQLRMRAEHWRTRAETAVFPETKQGFLRIADDYVELAQRAEQRIAWLSARSRAESPPASSADRANETDEQASPPPLDETDGGDKNLAPF
jgi:hypothetical protein